MDQPSLFPVFRLSEKRHMSLELLLVIRDTGIGQCMSYLPGKLIKLLTVCRSGPPKIIKASDLINCDNKGRIADAVYSIQDGKRSDLRALLRFFG